MADTIKEDKVLDARGLLCPMPVVKAGQTIRDMKAGEILKILTTDRGAVVDVPAWADDAGHKVIEWHDEGETFVFHVRKGADG